MSAHVSRTGDFRARVAAPGDLSWLAQRVGCFLTPGARGLKVVDGEGQIRGMVVYDWWTPNSVQAHMAVEAPLAWKALLPHCFIYPFLGPRGDGAEGRGVLLGLIRASNARSLKMAERLGFKVHSRVKDGYAQGEDLVLVSMRREECRYLKKEKNDGNS